MKHDVSLEVELYTRRQHMDENHSTKDDDPATHSHLNIIHDDDDDVRQVALHHHHSLPLLESSVSPPLETEVLRVSDCDSTTPSHHHHHYTNDNDHYDDDDDATCRMPFLTNTTTSQYDYSMVSSPRNTGTNRNSSSSSSSPTYHRHHPKSNNKSCCIGYIVCFLLAVSLPIVYQQYTLEERSFNVIIVKKSNDNTVDSTSTNSAVVVAVVAPPYHRPAIIIAPKIAYVYPTVEKNHPEDDENDKDDDHVNDDAIDKEDDATTTTTQYNLPKIAWLMSFPGSLGISHIIHSIEYYSQTTSATNYGATLLYTSERGNGNGGSTTTINNTSQFDVVLVNPIYSIQPNDQCGPFLHRFDLPLPTVSSSIVTNTFCSTAQTSSSSSSVVCTECVPTYHNALTFERACATGNRLYEQHYRSVQYDTRMPLSYIVVIQNPFKSILNRLRITFQQKIRMAQPQFKDVSSQQHTSDYFLQYQTDSMRQQRTHHYHRPPNTSIYIIEYCRYLDATYATLATTDLLDNYTHVPCHSEFYKYIQWYNDAVTLTSSNIKYNDNSNDDDDNDSDSINSKPVHYIYYEKYIAALLNPPERQPHDNVVQDLLDFLNLTTDSKQHHQIDDTASSFYDSVMYEASLSIWNETTIINYFPMSLLQKAADMIYELALPTTWELIRHYLEPYRSVNQKNTPSHHLHLHWAKKRKQHDRLAQQSIPMSLIYDTKISDDSTILSPLLFDDYKNTLYENPLREHDTLLLHPPEPNDPNPQVVWLLSFPNSVRFRDFHLLIWYLFVLCFAVVIKVSNKLTVPTY